MFLFAQSLLAVGAGSALYVAGKRGRRIDRRAVCRRCGFDLSARGPYDDRCPECGAGLFSRRAIVRGRRVPRPVLTLTGTVILLIGVMHGAIWGLPDLLRMNWNAQKPAALLLAEARGGSGELQVRALAELASRLEHRTLSSDQQRSLVDFAFDRAAQVIASRERAAAYGVLDSALRSGSLSRDEVLRFARSALRFRLAKQDRQHRDGAMYFEFTATCSSDLGSDYYFQTQPLSPTVTDAQGPREHWQANGIMLVRAQTRDRPIPIWLPPPVPPGDFTVSLPIRSIMYDARTPLVPVCEWEDVLTVAERFP